MNAFSYLRLSGICQVAGDGLARQRESIDAYARLKGLIVEREFSDEGVSGTKEGFDRPQLAALFASLRDTAVKIVLVERADRIARDLMVGEIIFEEFRKLGVKVIECEGGTELTVADNEPTKVLIRQILGAVAQFEKSVIVHKLKAARQRIRDRGERCEGGKPFGLLPGEEVAMNRIRELRGMGFGLETIVQILNNEKVPTRKAGARWHTTSVWRILSREN